jgi:hypothetical protein
MGDSIAEAVAAGITPKLVRRIRDRYGDQAAGMILGIAAEQPRAVEKFGPGIWMVTPKAIRQATDGVVAAYKAGLLGDIAIFDLCGGIGGDAIAFNRRGPVVTIDADPQISAMAAANLALANRCGGRQHPAVAVCADVTRYPIPTGVAVHIDPDRRAEKRVVRPEDYQPSLAEVSRLVDRGPASIVKIAPAALLENSPEGKFLAASGNRQWIGSEGSVREQTLLCGDAIAAGGVSPGGRSAVRLFRDGRVDRFAIDFGQAAQIDEVDRSLPTSVDPPRFLFDLDPAVRAAGLSAWFATSRRWVALGGPSGFFGAEELPTDRSLVQCFELLWTGPADVKQVKRVTRDRELWVDSVKVRVTGHDPEKWLKSLRADRSTRKNRAPGDAGRSIPSDQPVVTLLIGRHRGGVYAVIAKRL